MGYDFSAVKVRQFWQYMMNEHEFAVRQKGGDAAMLAIGWALDAMGIQDKSDFLKNYTTTLGRTVYVPFEIGVGTKGEMLSQICTCVHEAQHVVQFSRNELEFVKNYVFSTAARAHYEADAYRTNMEMHWFFTGKLLSPRALAEKLNGYGVKQADIHVTEKNLKACSKFIQEGGVLSGVSKEAIKWWKKNGTL